MANKGDIATVIMAAKLKNIRIYEYLMGALLDPDGRERQRKRMLEYKQETTTFLNSIKQQAECDDFGDPLSLLEAEVELNKALLPLVIRSKGRWEIYHGFGLPVNQCASKWMYQDFPSMLGMRTKDVYKSLPDLCTHVLEKYDCARDEILTDLCVRLEQAKNKPAAPKPSSDIAAAAIETEDDTNPSDTTQPDTSTCTTSGDSSDEEYILVVAEETTYPCVARESVVQDKQVGICDDGPGSGDAAELDNADTDEPYDDSVMELKVTVENALTQLTPTLSPSKNKHLQEDKPILLAAYDDAAQSEATTVDYWASAHETATPLPTTPSPCGQGDMVRRSRTPERSEQERRRSLVRPQPTELHASYRGTPLDPNYGTSPCSVRTSRLTPLRAPVKKALQSNTDDADEEDEEENPGDGDDLAPVELAPYTKPLWTGRLSHVQHVLEGGEESRSNWAAFRAHLDNVRRRVRDRLAEKVRDLFGIKVITTDHKKDTQKEKKRRRKSRCSKKRCKKHAEAGAESSENSSSDNPSNTKAKSEKDATPSEGNDSEDTDEKPRESSENSSSDNPNNNKVKSEKDVTQVEDNESEDTDENPKVKGEKDATHGEHNNATDTDKKPRESSENSSSDNPCSKQVKTENNATRGDCNVSANTDDKPRDFKISGKGKKHKRRSKKPETESPAPVTA